MNKCWLLLLLVARTASADCGQDNLDAYNANPNDPHNDEVLYNGGVCFEQSGAIGAAMQTFNLVLRYYPRSKLAPRALARTAAEYERIAQFDQAAVRYEEYAKKYAGEKDARDAIESAISMRAAIGDNAKRIEDTKYFVQTFGMKAPQEAADAMFAVAGAYDDPVKPLREYIKTYSAKGAREKLAIAYAKIGDALWKQSCPAVQVDGLCVKVVRDQAPRCNAAMARVVAVARTPAVRKDALAAYDEAIKVVDESGLKDPGSIHFAAMARIARADDDLERMIEQAFPTGLDFAGAGKERSMKRFQGWLADETKRGTALNRAYEAVLAMKDPSASIAAAARIGQVSETFARAMAVGEIPKDVRTGDFAKDKTQAYCDTLAQAADPLRAHAVEAFAVCAEKSIELSVIDDWTALCRREGAELDAKKFPAQDMQPQLAFVIPAAVEKPGKRGKQWADFVNAAIAGYDKARALPANDPQRKQLVNDAEFQAENALAIDADPLPLVVLAALAADSGDKRKLELARAYADRAIQIDDKNATVWAARAVVEARRGEWMLALSSADRAVTLAPHAEPALQVAGILAVRAGQFDAARTRLAAVKGKTYDVLVARGIAARGLGDLPAARSFYEQASKLDPARPEAPFDLGLIDPRRDSRSGAP
jgi:tetratricopeptide (TPR) repeat protein